MSGANFKVWVPLPDGRRCGIDVFGSFHIGERFYVTGSLTGTLDRSALLPFGTVTLEGREIAAPAQPEEVLAFTYGPEWRVPDPAFHFDHDPADVQRMEPVVPRAAAPAAVLAATSTRAPTPRGSRPSRRRSPPGRTSGWWTAATPRAPSSTSAPAPDATRRTSPPQGHQVVALDFTTTGLRQTEELRAQAGGTVNVRSLNLEDLRSVLVTGARFAHRDGHPPGLRPRAARHARRQRPRQPLAVRLDGAAPRRRDLPGVPHPALAPGAPSTSARTSARTSTRTPSPARWRPTVAPSCTARRVVTWPRSAPRTPHIARLVVRWTP